MTLWTIPNVRVQRVEERKNRLYIDGVGPEAQFREESLGFFAQFEGSYESLFLGHEKPDLEAGDRVDISIRRHERAPK